jgi:glycosyltransferase involved in cell wall biosynthesis
MSALHILSSPYSPVHVNNRIDAFSIAVFKFIKYMSGLGWNCIHYGINGCQVDCETVICLSTLDLDNARNIKLYNQNAALEIAKRKQPGDFILCFYGDENKGAAEFNKDLKIIEPSIGYSANAVFAPYRVFVSYSQMHYFYGMKGMLLNPSWNDAVIYNAISAHEFDYTEEKDDYVLYFGRVVESKGVHIAIQATEAAGKKLIIAGPGNLAELGYPSTPAHVTVVGACNVEQRRKLMSKARAIIGPTYYLEPFGNMIAEGYMSGTPAITSDWGAFAENVVHGVTGFRCKEFREFVEAIHNIGSIKPSDCRAWAMKNCEDTVVHAKYDQYFKRIYADNFYR